MASTGGLALINAVAADATKLTADIAAVSAAQAAEQTDTAAQSTDQAALAAFLASNGAQVVVNDDGTASVYLPAAASPGYTIVSATVAS